MPLMLTEMVKEGRRGVQSSSSSGMEVKVKELGVKALIVKTPKLGYELLLGTALNAPTIRLVLLSAFTQVQNPEQDPYAGF